MAALLNSDSKEEEFLGFGQQLESGRNISNSKSDISVSTINTEDLSDFELTDSETEEDSIVEWNANRDPVVVNPFVENTGPVTDVTGTSALDSFKPMFKEENFNRIAEETYRYARQTMAIKADPAWHEMNADEIHAFFAVNIMFGIKQLPEVHSYWSKNPLHGIWEIQKVFSRNRFKVSQYLHVNNKNRELPRGDANHDKLYKVRPLLDSVVSSIQSEYRPAKNLSIDEAMISFKGRLGIKQHMLLKPVKRGIKVWECANASNDYACNMSVYMGKERHTNPEQGLGYHVVPNLTRPLVGKNHHVFIDNLFSSIVLAENL